MQIGFGENASLSLVFNKGDTIFRRIIDFKYIYFVSISKFALGCFVSFPYIKPSNYVN